MGNDIMWGKALCEKWDYLREGNMWEKALCEKKHYVGKYIM